MYQCKDCQARLDPQETCDCHKDALRLTTEQVIGPVTDEEYAEAYEILQNDISGNRVMADMNYMERKLIEIIGLIRRMKEWKNQI